MSWHKLIIHTIQGYKVRKMLNGLYLTPNTLKFPVLKSSFWFSALARPKPTVSTERIKVRSLPKTNRTAHREKLEEKGHKSNS